MATTVSKSKNNDKIRKESLNKCLQTSYEFVLVKVDELFALIGGSLGGGIAWEMAVLEPNFTEHLIVVATDWKSTDWLIANCQIQEQFLLNSKNPVHDARMHAMLCYRTPESFKERFQRSKNEDLEIFNVES